MNAVIMHWYHFLHVIYQSTVWVCFISHYWEGYWIGSYWCLHIIRVLWGCDVNALLTLGGLVSVLVVVTGNRMEVVVVRCVYK